MHDSVLPTFRELTAKFEGRVAWPYLDVKGLVTVGLGCLIDPVERAIPLHWTRGADGPSLSEVAVRIWFKELKASPPAKPAAFYRDVTPLRLSEQAIDDLADHRVAANEAYLKKIFPEWDSWPADAQLGTMLLAWATGCGFDLLAKRGVGWARTFLDAGRECAWMSMASAAQDPLKGNPTGRAREIWLCFERVVDEENGDIPPRPQRVLSYHDTGEDVCDLRAHLHLPAGDCFDHDVWYVVEILQQAHGLVKDGVVGPKTRKAIGWRVD